MGKRTLMDIVTHFPHLNGTVVKTYFELLLLVEIALHKPQTPAVNVVTFFPTWLRSAIKKGAYRVHMIVFICYLILGTLYNVPFCLPLTQSAWQDQVPVQLQQKRIKVCPFFKHTYPPTMPRHTHSSSSYVNQSAPVCKDHQR